MKLAVVDYEKCKACRKCVARAVCSTKALFKIDPEEPAAVDSQLCYGCAKCVTECPHGALSVKDF
jgi:MinD superfamily P-loop ATPase